MSAHFDLDIDLDAQRTTRRLRDLIEPLAASVYFAPEAHDQFEALGFGPSAGTFGGLAPPEQRAYFTSRGGCMGQVPGEVIASAFGVFNPEIVVPVVDAGWAIADVDSLLTARMDGQRAFLQRVLTSNEADIARTTELLARGATAAAPAGRPLFAGLSALGYPGDAIGDLWRAADLVREHRGDGHTAAWTMAGLNGPEIMLLTELWWGIPRRSYALSRGWTTEQFDAADERLVADGLVADDQVTDRGLALRRAIETMTDLSESRVVAAIGSDADELIALLEPMAASIVENNGYPKTGFQVSDDL